MNDSGTENQMVRRLRLLLSAGRPVRSAARDRTALVLRGLAAAGVLLSADVHLQLWSEGFSQLPTIGPLFLTNAVVGLLIGVGVLVWRHWLPLLAAVGFGCATLVAFWMSVLVGLFGVRETATGVPQVLAEVAEIVAIGCGVAVLALEWWPVTGDRVHPGPTGAAAHRVRWPAGR